MSRHVLIDADVLTYESSFGAQRNRYIVQAEDGEHHFNDAKTRDAWLKETGLKDQPERYTVVKQLDVLDEVAALAICKNKLTGLLEKLEATSYKLFLTGRGNFRDEVATLTPYKGNRKDVEKPVHFAACRAWFENHLHATVVHGEEADDAIGYHQTKLKRAGIIASIDKDLRQLCGPHYEWHKDLKYRISEDASDRWFWLQMLMGDAADNIPGIKGIGEVKANKLLGETGTRQARADIVTIEYVKQYGDRWESYLQEVGQLLWIRREEGQIWNLKDYLSGSLVV